MTKNYFFQNSGIDKTKILHNICVGAICILLGVMAPAASATLSILFGIKNGWLLVVLTGAFMPWLGVYLQECKAKHAVLTSLLILVLLSPISLGYMIVEGQTTSSLIYAFMGFFIEYFLIGMFVTFLSKKIPSV